MSHQMRMNSVLKFRCSLQVVWSVILSNGSPFLVTLGLSKSLTALVWVAAPLCGVVVQPLVGTWSDRTQSRMGRRRPFILGGAVGVVISMLCLAWIEELVYGISRAPDYRTSGTQHLVISIAIFLIYILNISIQPLQAGLRTLIVENCPTHQQAQASAWAGAMTGVGNIVGYLSGFTALPDLLASKTLTQFQCLCVIASASLLIATAMSCSVVERNVPPERVELNGLVAFLGDLFRTYRSMPMKIRNVCHIQFCAWMGWFPFLFYSTT